MRKAIRTVDFRIGESISLEDLRDVVSETLDLEANSNVSVQEERGQRDAVYYHIVITEP